MKFSVLTFTLLLCCTELLGQNLVSNYSFETYSTCPNTASQITYATDWNNSRNSFEYLNSCSSSVYADVPTNYFGFQNASTGQAYAGGLMYGSFAGSYLSDMREFLYVPLTTPLTIGTTYYVSFKVNLADNSEYAVNNLGAQFCTSYNSNFPLNNVAHVYTTSVIADKTNWVTVQGSFVPTVAYTAVMFGNFFTDANTTVTFVGSSVDIGYNAYYLFEDIYISETVPLAVTLEEISAKNVGQTNLVDWRTSSEDAGDYFEVERSADGQTFSKIATVAATFLTGGNYQFQDKTPEPGINYYRLKMLDADGNSRLSKVVMAEVKEGQFVQAFPNPVSDFLNIQTSSETHGQALITITDSRGKTVRSIFTENGSVSIEMDGLASGYYLLHFQDDLISETMRIVKK
jgi:hypothetical protein